MLRFLGVRNLSVIDHLEVEFGPGMNVLTGETGAGKSVLVEAIGLLVGGRASADMIRSGEQLATVQAIFERADGRDVIVRREISAQGRSRAFIDDALATSAALKEFGAAQLELHGQHEHQSLLNPAEHADLLDTYAGHDALRVRVADAFAAFRAASDALERTQLSDREKRARIEMASFHLQEIEKVAPVAGEDERLAAEKQVLANADRLSRLSSEAYASLYEGDAAILSGFAAVFKRVADLAVLDPRFEQYVDQRDDLKARLEDLAMFLRQYVSDLEASPDRLQGVEDRLAQIERLKRKHGPSLDDVVAKQVQLRTELQELEASDEQIAVLTAERRKARSAFLAGAEELSRARSVASKKLAATLERDLRELAMPACRVEIRQSMAREETWSALGIDAIEFFLSPNPGEDPRPLARIASGGELSRIMLALRMAGQQKSNTLIFDEVDAGIGGAAADAVGARLQALGAKSQVLCVTHLAQIASRATSHFHVSKHVTGGRTSTSLSRLDGENRVQEIGRMIAGAEVSARVIESAREMLATRRRSGENSAKGESENAAGAKAKGKRGAR